MVVLKPSSLVLLITVLTAGLVGACGDDDGNAACGADVSGTVFGFDDGDATVSGSVTLPPDTAEGLSIKLGVLP